MEIPDEVRMTHNDNWLEFLLLYMGILVILSLYRPYSHFCLMMTLYLLHKILLHHNWRLLCNFLRSSIHS
jgi:hypothetical protein